MDREQQLDDIITAYLKAVDAGERVDQAEWLKRYPDLAGELADFFAGQQSVERVAAPLRGAGAPPALRDSADAPTMPPFALAGQETIAPGNEPVGNGDAPRPVQRVRYFGHYELLEEIARGGMGIVYRARQVKLNRLVAVKMILAGELAHTNDVERFYTEARAAARLHHSNIVAIHEVGQHDGQHYFSMDFIAGESLANRIARGPLPAREAALLLKKVAGAVAFAHIEGVIHRDLKPANVLLDAKGEPHVTDFGLAKAASVDDGSPAPITTHHSPLTISGQILGTPSYMPPEQAAGRTKEIGPRADVYSLGAVLYCALTARPPFQAAGTLDTLLQVLNQDPVPPRTLNAAVPPDLETICLKCLEKDPRRRYESAQALVDELDRYLEGKPILARPIGIAGRTVKWAKRRPAAAALVGVSLAALIALLTVGGLYQVQLTAALRDAHEQRGHVRERETVLRRHLYGYDIKAVQEARDKANMVRALTLLRGHFPKADQEDLRSFDWFHLWKLDEEGVITQRTPASYSLAYLRDGKYLVTAGINTIELRDPVSGGLLRTIRDVPGSILAVASDSKKIAAAFNNQIAVYDLDSGERRQELQVAPKDEGWVQQIVFSPTDPDLLAVVWGDARVGKIFTGVELIQLAEKTRHSLVKFPDEWSAVRIAFHTNGKTLAVANERELTFWDVATRQTSLKLAQNGASLAFSPNGKLLALASSYGGRLSLLDATNGKSVADLPIKPDTSGPMRLAFSPNNKMLAIAADMTIRLWDLAERKQTGTRLGHTGPISGLAFSPDSKRLISSSERANTALIGATEPGEIKIWQVAETPVPEPVTLDYRQNLGKGSYSTSNYTIKTLGFAPGSNRLIVSATKSSSSSRLPPAGLENELVFERPEYPSRAGPIRLHSATPAPTTHALCWQSVNLRRAAYSPDSKFVAVAEPRRLKSIAIWDTASGQTIQTLTKDHPLYAAAFSPDGKTLAGVGLDRTLTLWDVPAWTERAALRGHEAWIDALIFTADNKNIISASYDGVVKVWDAASGKERKTLPRLFRRLEFLRLSPDGQSVLIGGLGDDDERAMKLWDLAADKEKFSLANYLFGSGTTAFAPDRRSLAVVRYDKKTGKVEPCLLDLADGATRAVFAGSKGTITHLAFTQDGKSLAAASTSKMVTVWNVADQKQVTQLPFPEGVQTLAFAPDGKSLAAWNQDNTLRLWDTAKYAERFALRGSQYQEFWSVAFTADSAALAVQQINATDAKLYDVNTGELRNNVKSEGGSGMPPILAPDSKTVVSDNWISARLWDAATGKERAATAGELTSQIVATSPDGGAILATVGDKDQRATLWDVAAGLERLHLAAMASPIALAVFSSDGKALATAQQDGSLAVWDTVTGLRRHSVTDIDRDHRISRLAFTADGKILAAAGSDGKVRIFDAVTGAKLATLQAHSNRNLAFAPAGDLLATVDDAGALVLWDWKAGQEKTRLARDLRSVGQGESVLAFSADGRTLATCESRSVKLWDTTTGLERLTLWQGIDEIHHLAFSPDGRTLAAATPYRLYLWYASTAEEVAAEVK